MKHDKEIKLDSSKLNEAASKLIVSVCNKHKCTPDEALVIITNLTAKEAA